jgi:hypothetical protein
MRGVGWIAKKFGEAEAGVGAPLIRPLRGHLLPQGEKGVF